MVRAMALAPPHSTVQVADALCTGSAISTNHKRILFTGACLIERNRVRSA
jgi:hypothetical protein